MIFIFFKKSDIMKILVFNRLSLFRGVDYVGTYKKEKCADYPETEGSNLLNKNNNSNWSKILICFIL